MIKKYGKFSSKERRARKREAQNASNTRKREEREGGKKEKKKEEEKEEKVQRKVMCRLLLVSRNKLEVKLRLSVKLAPVIMRIRRR